MEMGFYGKFLTGLSDHKLLTVQVMVDSQRH